MSDKFVFPDNEVTYEEFFSSNDKNIRYVCFVIGNFDKKNFADLIFNINDINDDITVKLTMGENSNINMNVFRGNENITNVKDFFTKITIKESSGTKALSFSKTTGGHKASVKKEICGKLRCIYKIPGSRKEHIKYKGRLIAVADYKKLMKKA